MTKFEDIPDEIRRARRNNYEEKNNITTGKFRLLAGGKRDLWAVWLAGKSDGSNTLYFAFCSKANPDHWRWFTPTKEHIIGFEAFIKWYWRNETFNKAARENRQQRNSTKKPDFDWGSFW